MTQHLPARKQRRSAKTNFVRANAELVADDAPQLIRIRDFCARYSVSKSTALRLIARGELEAVRIGTRTRITGASAEQWLARCPRVQPASATVKER